jgi:hypothetical protein
MDFGAGPILHDNVVAPILGDPFDVGLLELSLDVDAKAHQIVIYLIYVYCVSRHLYKLLSR